MIHLVTVAALFDRSGHHNGRNTVVLVLLIVAGCLIAAGRKRKP